MKTIDPDTLSDILELAIAFECEQFDVAIIPVEFTNQSDSAKQDEWFRTAAWRYGLPYACLGGSIEPALKHLDERWFHKAALKPATIFALWLPRKENDGQNGQLESFAREAAKKLGSPWFISAAAFRNPLIWRKSPDCNDLIGTGLRKASNLILQGRDKGDSNGKRTVPFYFNDVWSFHRLEKLKEVAIPQDFIVAAYNNAGTAIESWQDIVLK